MRTRKHLSYQPELLGFILAVSSATALAEEVNRFDDDSYTVTVLSAQDGVMLLDVPIKAGAIISGDGFRRTVRDVEWLALGDIKAEAQRQDEELLVGLKHLEERNAQIG